MQSHSIQTIFGQRKDKEFITVLTILAALWLVLWLTGCTKQNNSATDTTTATTSTTTAPDTTTAAPSGTANQTTASNGTAPQNMSDANIIAALSEADSAEITEAKLALSKSKNPQVRAFAQMMISDHSRMKKDKAELAMKLNITPQAPANDQEPSELSSTLSAMKAAPNSRALDSVYMSTAVSDHQNDLNVARQMQAQASAPELKQAIASALPVIQKHLDHAQAVDSKLNSTGLASTKQTR